MKKRIRLSLIAAIASGNRALGKNNELIYHIPEDLKRFRKITSGHTIIMGRKTFESIGKILPNRTNIIITHDPKYFVNDAVVVQSLQQAINVAKTKEQNEIFIIGGGQIYQEAINFTDKLYLTVIEGNPEADTFFPDYSEFKKVIFEKDHKSNQIKYKFLDLER